MAARKITASERKVLERLIFPEDFEVVRQETGLQYGELRDDLISLLSFGYVEALEKKEPVSPISFYDTDKLHDFIFRATKKGLAAIKLPVR